jgi:hypothetical protein
VLTLPRHSFLCCIDIHGTTDSVAIIYYEQASCVGVEQGTSAEIGLGIIYGEKIDLRLLWPIDSWRPTTETRILYNNHIMSNVLFLSTVILLFAVIL